MVGVHAGQLPCAADADTSTESLKGYPNFSKTEVLINFPRENLRKIKSQKIEDGVPRMFFACAGNTTTKKHLNIGTSTPAFESFMELKELILQTRDQRFGQYADRISKADAQLRRLHAEQLKIHLDPLIAKHRSEAQIPKKSVRAADAKARWEAIDQLKKEMPPYHDWNEWGQAYSGTKLTMRSKCFACMGIYPYQQVIVMSKEEKDIDICAETGKNATRKHKCAESVASLQCQNLKPI